MTSFTKTVAIKEIVHHTKGFPVIFTTGYASRIGASVADRPHHFYMTGSMGLALSLGIGVASAVRRTTVVADGDGSVLMNPGGVISAGARTELPLVHIVLDDGQYASTGGQAAPRGALDFAGWARSAGFQSVHRISDRSGLAEALGTCVGRATSPQFLHCVLTGTDELPPARISQPLSEHAHRFAAAVASGDL
ncbi:thiamine pyrophosphate-dependent enzyme [Streptomyces lydicus]